MEDSASQCAEQDDPQPSTAYAALSNGLRMHLEMIPGLAMAEEDLKEAILRAWARLRTAAIRGGVAGLTVRGGLHLMSTLFYLLRRTSKSTPTRQKQKRELTMAEIVRDTARYTIFLATLGGSYVAVDEGLAILLGKERTAKWRALVAGAVAGHTVLLTGHRTRHHSLATYVLLRGLTLLVRCGNKPGPTQGSAALIRTLLAPTRFAHGDVLLMCLASSQIIYSYIMMPGTLPPSYIRFITKQAAKEPHVWTAVREQAMRNWQGRAAGPIHALHGTSWQQCCDKVPCEFWHAGYSCHAHPFSIIPNSYLRSLGVYIPVYLLPAVLVHRQKLLSQPLHLLPKIITGISRSALFLTSFISIAFAGACLGFNLTGNSTGPIIAAFTCIGGLATLIEKKSRRMELALYCGSRALESFARCLHEWGALPATGLPIRADVLMFALGCAAIMHCYSDANGKHRDVFKSKYLNVLDFVFGNTGVEAGRITHHPSNLALLRSVRKSLRSFSSQRLDAEASNSGSSLHEPGSRSGTRCHSAGHLALPPYQHLPCLADGDEEAASCDEDGEGPGGAVAAAHVTYTILPPHPAPATNLASTLGGGSDGGETGTSGAVMTSGTAGGVTQQAVLGGWTAAGVVATSSQVVVPHQLPGTSTGAAAPGLTLKTASHGAGTGGAGTAAAGAGAGGDTPRTRGCSLDVCSSPGTASSHSLSHYARPGSGSMDDPTSHSSSHSALSSVAITGSVAAGQELPSFSTYQPATHWLQPPGALAAHRVAGVMAGHGSLTDGGGLSMSVPSLGAAQPARASHSLAPATSSLRTTWCHSDSGVVQADQSRVLAGYGTAAGGAGGHDVACDQLVGVKQTHDLTHRYAEDISVRGGRDTCGWSSLSRASRASSGAGGEGCTYPIRRILTAPGDLSTILAGLASAPQEVPSSSTTATTQELESRVHGGSVSHEHMVHGGQSYTEEAGTGRTHRRHNRSFSSSASLPSLLHFAEQVSSLQHPPTQVPAAGPAGVPGHVISIHKVVPVQSESQDGSGGVLSGVVDGREGAGGPRLNTTVHVVGSGVAGDQQQAPGPPVFMSSLLGRAAAAVQFVGAAHGANPPAINVVHTTGLPEQRTSVLPSAQRSVAHVTQQAVLSEMNGLTGLGREQLGHSNGTPLVAGLAVRRPGSPACMSTTARIRAELLQEATRCASSPASPGRHQANPTTRAAAHSAEFPVAAQSAEFPAAAPVQDSVPPACWPASGQHKAGFGSFVAVGGCELGGAGRQCSQGVDVSLHEWSSYEQEVALQVACGQGKAQQGAGSSLCCLLEDPVGAAAEQEGLPVSGEQQGEEGSAAWGEACVAVDHVNGMVQTVAGGAGSGDLLVATAKPAASKPPAQQHQSKKGKGKKGKGRSKH